MHYVDGYIFPCYSCGNPGKQVSKFHGYSSGYFFTHQII
jgi:hypothetical protein